jgi:hypothetical protein
LKPLHEVELRLVDHPLGEHLLITFDLLLQRVKIFILLFASLLKNGFRGIFIFRGIRAIFHPFLLSLGFLGLLPLVLEFPLLRLFFCLLLRVFILFLNDMHHLKELGITTNTPSLVHFGFHGTKVLLAVMSAATVLLTDTAVFYLQRASIAVCFMPLAAICIASKLVFSL